MVELKVELPIWTRGFGKPLQSVYGRIESSNPDAHLLLKEDGFNRSMVELKAVSLRRR